MLPCSLLLALACSPDDKLSEQTEETTSSIVEDSDTTSPPVTDSEAPDSGDDTGTSGSETGGDDTGGGDTSDDTEAPELCPESASLAIASVAVTGTPSALARHLEVSLSEDAALGVACTRDDHPDELLYWESESADEHDLDLFGLAPSSDYRCQIAPLCPTMSGPPEEVTFQTEPPPSGLPGVTITQHPTLTSSGAPMVVMNAAPCDGGGAHYLVMYDLNGEVRWFHRLSGTFSTDVVVQYLGDGVVVWGGGFTPNGAPRTIDLFGAEIDRAAWPGSSNVTFNHEARMLEDGRLLGFDYNTNTDGDRSWQGYQIFVTEPGTNKLDWTWSSQVGVDAELFPPGSEEIYDIYHGNWADILTRKDGTERAYVSMCYLSWIVAIDVDSSELLWRFGLNGDFALVNADGSPAADEDWPDCQHGIEVDDDTLLVYDNGRQRGASRVSTYTLDEAAMTATRTWSWTEEGWVNPWLGDADFLPDDRVFLTQANPTCFEGLEDIGNHLTEVDMATGEVVWRATIDDPDYLTYRSERADTCDVMPHVQWCSDVRERWEAAAGLFSL